MKKKATRNYTVDEELIKKGKGVMQDFSHSDEIYVVPKRLDNKLISIRLPIVMIQDLRNVAIAKGDVGYQQIIKTYIAEGLKRENMAFRSSNFGVIVSCDENILSASSSLDKEFSCESITSGKFEFHSQLV